MSSLFDHPITPPLRTVLAQIAQGELLIPDFQRPFVWKESQRLQLLDSIAQGLPIGAILVWRSRGRRLRTYKRLGPFCLRSPSEGGPWTYVIDGHQRLTTLFAALTPHEGDGFDNNVDGRWPVFVDLRDPSPTFTLQARGQRPTLVPSHVLTNNKLVYERQRALWAHGFDAEATRLEDLANQFKDYPIPVIPMVTEDISVVTRAFARINTGGTKMSEAHLAAALAYAQDHGHLRAEFERLEALAAAAGFPTIDQGALLNALKLRFDLDVYRTDIDELLEKIGAVQAGSARARSILQDLETSLLQAFDVLRSIKVCGSGSLPYRYQALLLTEALRRTLPIDCRLALLEKVQTWFWQTTFTEAFTGATGSQLRNALYDLVAWLEGTASAPHDREHVSIAPQQSRWGSVRRIGRTLALAQCSNRVADWLGALGKDAVQKLLPELADDRPGSWIVTDPDTLRKTRKALKVGSDLPLHVQMQLGQEALLALRQGDLVAFADLQDTHVLAVERRCITSAGLVPKTSG